MQKNKLVHEDIKAVCNSAAKKLVAVGLVAAVGLSNQIYGSYTNTVSAQPDRMIIDNDDTYVIGNGFTQVYGDGETTVTGNGFTQVDGDGDTRVNGGGKTTVYGAGGTLVRSSGFTQVNGDGVTRVFGVGLTQVDGNGGTRVNGDGLTYVVGNGNTRVVGNGFTQVDGTGGTRVEGPGDTLVYGNGRTQVRGNGTTQVDGNGGTRVNGPGFTYVVGNGTTRVVGNGFTQVDGAGETQVDGTGQLTVTGNGAIAAEGANRINAGERSTVYSTSSNLFTHDGTGAGIIDGGDIEFSGFTEDRPTRDVTVQEANSLTVAPNVLMRTQNGDEFQMMTTATDTVDSIINNDFEFHTGRVSTGLAQIFGSNTAQNATGPVVPQESNRQERNLNFNNPRLKNMLEWAMNRFGLSGQDLIDFVQRFFIQGG